MEHLQALSDLVFELNQMRGNATSISSLVLPRQRPLLAQRLQTPVPQDPTFGLASAGAWFAHSLVVFVVFQNFCRRHARCRTRRTQTSKGPGKPEFHVSWGSGLGCGAPCNQEHYCREGFAQA